MAVINNTFDNVTPTAITGGAAAVAVVAANAANVMVKIWSSGPAFWGGPGVTASDGIPFQGETDWMPTATDVYVFAEYDVDVRGVKGT
jgi:hypothetical protein